MQLVPYVKEKSRERGPAAHPSGAAGGCFERNGVKTYISMMSSILVYRGCALRRREQGVCDPLRSPWAGLFQIKLALSREAIL